MIAYERTDLTLTESAVFRRWVRRERRKSEYPDADPDEWDVDRLRDELEATVDEPAEPASRGSPTWTTVVVDGGEVGEFDAFPACGWDTLTNDGTIADAVDRLVDEDLSESYPDLTESVAAFREGYPEADYGALVARQFDDEWPPILLEGNHRSCAAHLAAREGSHVELEVHLGHERPFDDLPFEKSDSGLSSE
jgi:hypothetical protein